jgi:TatA/E family protein of Tat protein translocase
VGIENPLHLLFIAAVALLVLGPRRLPDLAKALGHGIREFREAMSDGEDGEVVPGAAATAQAPPPAPVADGAQGPAASGPAAPESSAAPPASND